MLWGRRFFLQHRYSCNDFRASSDSHELTCRQVGAWSMHIQSYFMKCTYNGSCADSGNREMTSRRASTGVLHTRPPANALLDPSQLAAFVVLHLLATVTLVSLAFYLTAASSPPSPRNAGGQSQVTVRAIQLRCIYLRIVGPPHGNLPGRPQTHQKSL